jgi:hypothetical protein
LSQYSSQRQASSSIIIDPSVGGDIIIRSRSHTPILPSEADDHLRQLDVQQQRRDNETLEKQVGAMRELMVKHGKQIRALYQLLKSMDEKLGWVQNHLKKDSESSVELSAKVFAVSKIQRFPFT